ncbi:6-phosphofructokinase II [Edwardsiella ictaluri]|uniref:PfkB family carbohydrate kinase n=1 Tax=Edwardsiella ictaluri TaxID=67780 RepID=UPI0009C08907|nr:PfkB family carbohydrate kinase [Edwardsiella ictaluri]ARD38413.1 hypothetical protein B6E78_02430 [Edwardsiella ictaluri]QPW26831.1 6-phosphofructokinase II [Edwardsiella ictaluri]
MNPVYTLTLSPSLDCSTSTDKIYPEGKLRCSQAIYQPGGGGVNVARAIYRMGGGAVAIYPAGGSTGAYLTTLLLAEGIAVDVVEVQSWTRQNMHINVTATGEQFRFVMPGADLTPRKFDLLTQRLDQIPADAFLVVSGSLPESITPQRFAALLQYVCQRGIRCVVDTSGDALMTAVSQGVGAGDSMVAAMTLQLALGGSLSTLAIGGVAAGTAATLRHGTELCQASDVAEIAAYIEAHHPQSHPF